MTWDDFERMLCWIVIAAAKNSDKAPWLNRLECESYYGFRWPR